MQKENLFRLLRELSTIRVRIEELRDAIQEHSKTIYAAQEAQQQAEKTRNPTPVLVSYDDQTVRDAKDENNRQHATQHSIKNWTKAAVVAATIYAGIAAFTYFPMKKAADGAKSAANTATETMHIDQRPWINISVGQTVMQDGVPLRMPVRIVNSGKTPAYKFHGFVVVNLLNQADQPDFDYTSHIHPKYEVGGGVVIPNAPMDLAWAVLPKYVPLDKPITPIVATGETRKAIGEGSQYIVVHGEVTYSDIFGTPHWLKVCSYAAIVPDIPEKTVADTCGQYNDVDKNH